MWSAVGSPMRLHAHSDTFKSVQNDAKVNMEILWFYIPTSALSEKSTVDFLFSEIQGTKEK